jgi:hypothetical protein
MSAGDCREYHLSAAAGPRDLCPPTKASKTYLNQP